MRTMRDSHVNNSPARVTTRVMSFSRGTRPPLWESGCYYEPASQARHNTSSEVVAINRIFVRQNPFLLHAVASYVVLVIKFFITVLTRSKRVQYNNRMKTWPILQRGLGVAHVSDAPRFSFFSPLWNTSCALIKEMVEVMCSYVLGRLIASYCDQVQSNLKDKGGRACIVCFGTRPLQCVPLLHECMAAKQQLVRQILLTDL